MFLNTVNVLHYSAWGVEVYDEPYCNRNVDNNNYYCYSCRLPYMLAYGNPYRNAKNNIIIIGKMLR